MGEFFHQVGELGEEVVRIVRAWRGFGVVLHAEEGSVFVAHAFVGVVVEIQVRDFDVAGGQRVGIDAEAVILRGDFDLVGQKIFYRMIRAVVAEFQFEGFAAQREAAELVAEADAENGDAARQLADIVVGIGDRFRIARAVGEEDAVRLEVENIFGERACGNDGNFAVMIDEQAQNVLLDAEIVGDHSKFVILGRRAGLSHLFRPRRSGKVDGALLPIVRFAQVTRLASSSPAIWGSCLASKIS